MFHIGCITIQNGWEVIHGLPLNRADEILAKELELHRSYFTPSMTKEEFELLKKECGQLIRDDTEIAAWRTKNVQS